MLVPATLGSSIALSEVDIISSSIVRVLLYFKIFNYPLRKEELYQYAASGNKIEVQAALAKLIGKGYVQCKQDFVWIDNPDSIISTRLLGNKRAERFLSIARKQAWWLSKFPFIKCICVSGSLSKRYMEKRSDIDYFLIVKSNRLWITKLFISSIVKFLQVLGLKKFFCPNYIITENNLKITDRNIYTAIEIATLIPVYNQEEYEKFVITNNWISDYFPHNQINRSEHIVRYNKKRLKHLWEHRVFNFINNNIFHFYKHRYMMKLRRGKIIAFDNDLVITEDDFKLHLNGHRKRILQKFQENIHEFEARHDMIL